MSQFLTIAQICERLPVGRGFVSRLIHNGTLPHHRLGGKHGRGGKILVAQEYLDAVMAACRKGDEPEPPDPEPPPSKRRLDFQRKIREKVERCRQKMRRQK